MNSCLLILLSIFGNASIKTIGNTGVEINFAMEKTSLPDLSFPGAAWLNKQGEPNLPSLIYHIGIPQNSNVEVSVVTDRGEVVRDVTIEPVRHAGIYEGAVTRVVQERGARYSENRFFPESMIEVSRPGYLRDIYTVTLRINPVQYNPVTRELRISRQLRVIVLFKGSPRSRSIVDDSFEAVYKRTLVNYEQCKSWRREPLFSGINPFNQGSWFKIVVGEEGVYRIGYDEIKEAGLDPSQFDPISLRLYTAGFEILPTDVVSDFGDTLVEVPVYVHGEEDHSFDPGDYLIFYGYPASHFLPAAGLTWFENGYALDNVYWLTFGGGEGKRMELVDVPAQGSQFDTLVTEIMHLEDDVGNPTRSGINWYWQDISLGMGFEDSVIIGIAHPRARGWARIKAGVFTLNSGNFIYQLALGGTPFYTDTLDLGIVDQYPPYLLEGVAHPWGDSSGFTLKLTRPAGTSTALTAFLNGLDIEYTRGTNLGSPFHAFYDSPRAYNLRCSNVNSSPFILDITDLRRPRMFDVSPVNSEIQFSSTCDSFQLLYFVQLSSVRTAELLPGLPGRLRSPSAGAEYLFITHKNFVNAIAPLVSYRGQEYSTKVVQVDDIYDDFSFGKYDPLAIKHFLYYTMDNWTTIPKYVLLVGDGTYDYKNNLQKSNPPNFIPMYESGTRLSGNPGIPPNHIYDGEYVNFGSDESMILGRITVRNNQEVRDFVDKLLNYELADIDGLWNKRVILAGDDEWSNTYGWENPISFHCGACERMLAFFPDSLYDAAKLYMISYPPFSYPAKKANAQKDFIAELNRGCLVGAFYGHGNTHQLADEGLFYDTNIPEIRNGRRSFLYYFGSCTVGRFDDSDYECIGEQFVRIREGAIGTLAATAGTGCTGNEAIGQALFQLATDPDTGLTMGECAYLARDGYWGFHYLLLGDPATHLRRIDRSMLLSASPDSLRPLEQLRITSGEDRYYLGASVRDTTSIEKIDATTLDRINGYIFRLVQSGASSYTPFGYQVNGKEIYEGLWDSDTARIIVPKIVTTHRPVVKLSAFANGRSVGLDSIRVFGYAPISPDQDGPAVEFYDGARRLNGGDWVDKDFTLTGRVTDESGVNLLYSVDNARGFYLYINQDIGNKSDLRDHFLYDRNSFTTGAFHIALNLPTPVDTITVNVADNNDKVTTSRIVLNAEVYGRISIDNFLVYPNPVRNDQGLWFTFDLTDAGRMTLKIFTVAGRLIKTIEDVYCPAGYNQLFWNSLDEYQDRISNGVYLVKAYVTSDGGHDELVEKFIIAR